MLKRLAASLTIVFCIVGYCASALTAPGIDAPQATESETQEAREIAVQFTLQFAGTKDLTPIVKELYLSDFMRRYIESRANNPEFSSAPHVYFLPGLEYNSQLLRESSAPDWQRFYIAANNFLLLGFVSSMKKATDDATEIKPTDLYPSSVTKLLDKNPNLANVILRKGPSKPVSTVEEMRNATATLEQADAIMREKFGSRSLLKVDAKELAELMKQDNFFKPRVETAAESFPGFPKGARIVFMKTPLGLQLILARDGNRLKIFWTEIMAD